MRLLRFRFFFRCYFFPGLAHEWRSVGESVRAVVFTRFRLRGIQLKSAIRAFLTASVRSSVDLCLECVCERTSTVGVFPASWAFPFFSRRKDASGQPPHVNKRKFASGGGSVLWARVSRHNQFAPHAVFRVKPASSIIPAAPWMLWRRLPNSFDRYVRLAILNGPTPVLLKAFGTR